MVEESILDIESAKLTPGMRQYQDAKRENPDCIILLRMGDFYELFYEDAVTAARELDITLTSRGKGEKRAPLAGVPYHALETYLGRLVKKGYKVAIVEQLEDPKKAKGLVKRGCVRIVTPGTVMENSMLDEKENNFILSLVTEGERYYLSVVDISTGEFFTYFVLGQNSFLNELTKFNPKEVIVPESLLVNKELVGLVSKNSFVNTLPDYFFKEENALTLLSGHFNSYLSFGLEGKAVNVSGGLLQYLLDTQKNNLSHISSIHVRSNSQTMMLDASTFKNLELVANLRDGSSRGTLLSVIDKTVTAMGSRLLKLWLKQPLLKIGLIEKRLEAVSQLVKDGISREELNSVLKEMYDLERLIGRVNYGTASPRDLVALRLSLEKIPLLKVLLEKFSGLLGEIAVMEDLAHVATLIKSSIVNEPPITIREGGIIANRYNEELDSLRDIRLNGKKYIQQLEESERARTGISTLKIGFNRVFGYYIEVTKKNLASVPQAYIRKQTTANAERYITEELKIEEEKILGAEEKIKELEYKLFMDILSQVADCTKAVQDVARKVAAVDVLCSFATVSVANRYCKPTFVSENVLQVREGRHPVVEKMGSFIPNDVSLLDGEMMIITGPNMAGKSTVMRQTALIVLMAQVGCFVPASECVMGVVDRIFTRVGASDDISSGQSTFMVEMTETAAILNSATSRSLVIMDEIGRGTSTFDGVSIAWSVAEYIHNNLKCKTLFATHYHVMNKLASRFDRVSNYNIAVKEVGGSIVFLRKLVRGGTDQSYGIHVAKLAGLPSSVVTRALEVQESLHKDDEMSSRLKVKKVSEQKGLGDF